LGNKYRRGTNRDVAPHCSTAIMTKSPAPCISAMSKPPPGVNTGKAVLCAVSLANSVVVMVTPACIRPGASSASTVLPRSTPCWSANENRTSSSLCFLIANVAALAARACSPVHRPCRSTKLTAEGRAIRRRHSGSTRSVESGIHIR
jgi:hypothetical protein